MMSITCDLFISSDLIRSIVATSTFSCADAAIAGMFCSCMETTTQVLSERRSMAERERLFEMTNDLFGVATYDGFLKTLNPAWSRVLT